MPDVSEKSAGNLVSDARNTLADRLRRALRGKKRAEIIQAAGVSDGTITKILKGHTPRHGTLMSIAEAAGVRPEWLINGTGWMTQEYDEIAQEAERGPTQPIEKPNFDKLPVGLDLRRLGTVIRLAVRQLDSPDSPATWKKCAKTVIEFYNELTDMEAAAVDEM